MEESPLVSSLLQVIRDYDSAQKNEILEKTNRIIELENEIALLEKEVMQASIDDEVFDEALKGRLSKLKSAPLDTIIREAGVVLEDRLRAVGNSSTASLFGVKLVDSSFEPGKGPLIYSNHPGEQEGVLMLFRGAIQFIRNPPMHKLIEYPEGTAKVLVRLIDSLLLLLEEGKPRITGQVSIENIRLMLTRRAISDNQRQLFKILSDAGETGVTYTKLTEKLNMSRGSLAGLFGALGRRVSTTKGLEGKNIGVLFEIININQNEWRYVVRPIFRQALEAEKII
jgi:hypothetical protein